MKILPAHSPELDPFVIETAVCVLRSGGVVAHPTDTCYGLAVDIMNPDAVKLLYDRKGMPYEKPVSILVSSLEEAFKYGKFSELALRMAEDFWPGPLTLVVPRKKALPEYLNPGADKIGLRVINEPVSMTMLEVFEGPVTTTSANLHGEPTPYVVSDITTDADVVLDVGELKEHDMPSTVIEVVGGKATTLRRGDLFDMYSQVLD